jgi:hypothetical protein
MKKLMWVAIGAVVVQQIAKYFKINSLEDVKDVFMDLKNNMVKS